MDPSKGLVLLEASSKNYKVNMIAETKDSIANLTTIAATSAVMIDWQNVLTLILVVSGIVFNVIRIYEVRTKMKKDRSED